MFNMFGSFLTTILTIIFIGLSSLSVIAFLLIRKYNLPVPLLLSLLSTSLPFLDLVLAPFTASSFASSQQKQPQSSHRTRKSKKPLSTLLYTANLLILILQTVSLTSNSTSLSPELQQCTLQQTWQKWYSTKQGDTIKEVQDSLACCGFNGVLDMPYPFPHKPKKDEDPKSEVPQDTCAKSYGPKARPCGVLWQGKMSKVAALYVAVSAVLAFWKFVFLVLAWGRPDILATLFKSKPNDTDYRIIEEVNDEGDEGDEEDSRKITNGESGRITNGVNGHSHLNSETSRLIMAREYGAIDSTDGEQGGDDTGIGSSNRPSGGRVNVAFDSDSNAWGGEADRRGGYD
ncbi:hypothetical protein TWF694_001931 [Orbilia ellipsospora]|uniref:Tetraspanin Tsp3 n=1 Tax=Orbilia ellipsospora TaxID=2528407 RepID=A0AAV9X4D5_9PEZI